MNRTVASHLCPHPGLLFGFLSVCSAILLLFAIISNILFLVAIRKVYFNRNTRFCLTNIGVSLLLYSFPAFNRYVLGIRSLWEAVPATSNEFCALTTAPAVVLKIVTLFSQGSLALDRSIELKKATKAGSDHKQVGKISKFDSPHIINWSVGASWVLGLVVGAGFLADGLTSEGSLCFCITLHEFKSPIAMFLFFILLGLTSFVLYFIVWLHSVRAKATFNLYTVYHDLDARYALVQNIKTTEVMLPAVVANSAFDVVSFGALSVTVFLTLNEEQSLLMASFAWWMFSIQLLLHPLACSFKSPQLRKAMKDLLRSFLSCGRAKPTAVGAAVDGGRAQVVNHKISSGASTYLLEAMWKTGGRRRTRQPRTQSVQMESQC